MQRRKIFQKSLRSLRVCKTLFINLSQRRKVRKAKQKNISEIFALVARLQDTFIYDNFF